VLFCFKTFLNQKHKKKIIASDKKTNGLAYQNIR
jgi:hypothetical protein